MTKAKGMARSEFGEAVGVSNAMIGKWIKAGMPMRSDGLLDAAVCHAWLAANIERRTDQGDGEKFADAKARKEAALASLRELELQQKRGETLDAAEAKAAWSNYILEVRDKLLVLPSQLQDRLAAISDAVKIGEILETEIRRVLTILSNYRPGAGAKGPDDAE